MKNKGTLTSTKSLKINLNSLYSNGTGEQIKILQETTQFLRKTNSQMNENILKYP